VIIWVNGTFGAGKTTTGRALVQRDPRLRLFDPEWVGFMLMNNLADQDFTDFQQLESWRKLTPLVVDELVRVTGQDLVAAQTVLDEHYWHELQSGLAALGHEVVHVVVEADEVVMRQRIAADQNEPDAKQWRLDHLPNYAAARAWLMASADLVLDTTALTPEDAADQIWKVAATRVSSGPRPVASGSAAGRVLPNGLDDARVQPRRVRHGVGHAGAQGPVVAVQPGTVTIPGRGWEVVASASSGRM
jgi:hypothetical protein